MDYIDPHLHMVSRTTDDYATLARMGCVAISEPAFWAGYDRGGVEGFRDYFEQLTAVEDRSEPTLAPESPRTPDCHQFTY